MRGTCSPGFVVRADARRPSRSSRRRSRRSPPSRWSRSPTSSGRTSGSGSPPTPSTAPGPSSAPRPSSKPGQPAAGRDPPVAPAERAVAAARRGRPRACASSATPRRSRAAERLSTMAAALRFNNLKIATSEQAPRVCQGAMGVCGIVGYKNDTPFSVGRHLRDTMSRLPDGRQRAHPRDERQPAADRQGGLAPWPSSARLPPTRRRSSTSSSPAGCCPHRRARRLRARRRLRGRAAALRRRSSPRAAAPDGARASCASRRCCRASSSRPAAT